MASIWDSWDEFRLYHEEKKAANKGRPHITLYGSYYPEEELNSLIRLKQVLIEDGFKKTALVRDRKKEGDDPLEISRQCLEFSDINLFVFTKAGKRYGMVDEIAILTTEAHLFGKIQFSKVFDQIKEGRSSLPDLTKSRIKQNDISYREFSEIQDLEKIIVDSAYWLTTKWMKGQGNIA